MAKMWKFENVTTGKEMECNDLNFLLYQLREIQGLNIPHPEVQKLLFNKEISCTVEDIDGEVFEIRIVEFESDKPIGRI